MNRPMNKTSFVSNRHLFLQLVSVGHCMRNPWNHQAGNLAAYLEPQWYRKCNWFWEFGMLLYWLWLLIDRLSYWLLFMWFVLCFRVCGWCWVLAWSLFTKETWRLMVYLYRRVNRSSKTVRDALFLTLYYVLYCCWKTHP